MEELTQLPVMNPKSGQDNPGVRAALKLLEKTAIVHNRRENEWRAIQDLFESAFDIYNPEGNKKISSKLLQQVIWRAMSRSKPVDYQLQGTGSDENKEKIVTDGVSTVMERGNYGACLRDKGGAFFKYLLFGDAFIQIGVETEQKYPIKFRVCSLSDVYVDPHSVDIRDATGGLSANEALIIFRYSYDQFCELYPDMEGKVGIGKIPRSINQWKQLEKDWIQELNISDTTIEVGHYYNAAKKEYVIFAGPVMTVVNELKGEEFPFVKEENGYVPLLHFKCFPSSEGFYNYGIGHALYDLAVVTARMDNMAVNHAEENVWPISLVNVPKGQEKSFFNKILMAHQMRAAGSKGYAPMEYDATGSNKVSIEAFQSPPITQEWERAFTRLEQQIKRLGFRVDDPDLGANPNQMSIMADQEAADDTLKQIGEMNASEYKFAVELAMDFIKKFIDDDDDTVIDMSTNIELEVKDPMTGQPVKKQATVKGITMGQIKEELSKGNYWVKVNVRSGAEPSNVFQLAQIQSQLQVTPPGTPAYNKLAAKMARLKDQDITIDDFSMPQAAPPGADGSTPPPEAQAPTTNYDKAGTLKQMTNGIG